MHEAYLDIPDPEDQINFPIGVSDSDEDEDALDSNQAAESSEEVNNALYSGDEDEDLQ